MKSKPHSLWADVPSFPFNHVHGVEWNQNHTHCELTCRLSPLIMYMVLNEIKTTCTWSWCTGFQFSLYIWDCPTMLPVTVVEVWKRPGTVPPCCQWLLWRCERGQGLSYQVTSDCCGGVKEARDCSTRSLVTVVEVWKRPGTVLPGHQWLLWRCERGQGLSYQVTSDCCGGVKEARDCPTRSPVTVVEVWKRPGTVLPGRQWPVVEVWKRPGTVLPGRQWPVVEVWKRPGTVLPGHQWPVVEVWKRPGTVLPGCQWPVVEVWKRPGTVPHVASDLF